MLDLAAAPVRRRRLGLAIVGIGEDGRRLGFGFPVVAGQLGLLGLQRRRPARHPLLVLLVDHGVTVVLTASAGRGPLS
jgi:hypothetical protein